MPTTRSQGRSEPLQRLETPPKRQPAELRDGAAMSVSQKRSRDDESEDEHVAKRHQFSTPQNKPNNLWMFGERANGDHPRTAPSKTMNNQSLRRPMRGPLARRNNITDSPRFRVRASATSERKSALENVEPIQQSVIKQNTKTPEENQLSATHEEEETAPVQSQQQPAAPQTPRRGLFGSLRGIVNRGWDLAASLTPITTRTSPPANQTAPQSQHVNYPQLDENSDDEDLEMPADRNVQYPEYGRVRKAQPVYEPAQPSSKYDHLHYIPADVASINKAISGELAPPRPPTPPSPASRLKAQNPGLSDATIEAILKKRERKAALDEQRYGPAPVEEVPTVAPLFGPDSHYSRGTNDPRFIPESPSFIPSNKRKLDSVNGQIPRPRSGGFGIDDEYLDIDTEIISVDTPSVNMFEPPVKKARTHDNIPSTAPATPRSALKKPGFSTVNGRKSVAFGQSISRDIRGHYGPAGQYKGSTFADELPDDSRSPSSIDQSDVISPATRLNTVANSGKKPASVLDNLGSSIPAIDFTLRDPNDTKWRPSLGNPRPGVFRVPDIDEEDPDEIMSDVTPEQPSTPRMSHAELPAAPSTVGSVSFNESSIINESTELALDKARSRAEKYKPKSSSRLSEVSRARSRSTSPDAEEEGLPTIAQIIQHTSQNTALAVQPIIRPPQPFVPRELDNTTVGSDGMTDHQREHQYDDWAAGLDWDAPQTYEDAGTGSAFIHNLIRKNWTEEDSQRSEAFWAREFEEVDRAMKDAQAQGHRLALITGMEGIEGY